MAQNEITTWLARKRRHGMRVAALYAAATLTGGALVLGLTFCFIFVTAKVLLLSAFPLSPFVTAGSAFLAVVVTGLIFADALRVPRDDMAFLPGWLFRECFSIGPRLILEGWPYVVRRSRFARMDLESCTNALAYLAEKNLPTSRDQLARILPEVQWSRLAEDLRLLAGVIFFRPDGLRVILAAPLRLELRALLARNPSASIPEPEPPPVAVIEPAKLSPAEILGVLPAASLSQIKTAYRSRIKECHPDLFAAMDEPARALAEEWTKSLNAAYECLISETRRQSQSSP